MISNINMQYPDLVEQMYLKLNQEGIKASKRDIFKNMIEANMITQNGEPTDKAIKEGLVSVFETTHNTLAEFKEQYSIFSKYEDVEFCHVDNTWYISSRIVHDIELLLKKKRLSAKELNQVISYYELRNYDNPQSIQEFKAVNYPMYDKYADELFTFQDGQVLMPLSVTKDIANRVLDGEIEGNSQKALEMLQELENYDKK